MTPCGTKCRPNLAALTVKVEIDVPPGATLLCAAGALGQTRQILTAQIAGQSAGMDAGAQLASTDVNQVERLFQQSLDAGLSAGDTVTITMEDAGQGFTTTMWATLLFVPG